jgi:hypothetical protein
MGHWLIPGIIPAFTLGPTAWYMLGVLPFCASPSPPGSSRDGWAHMLASQASGACPSLTHPKSYWFDPRRLPAGLDQRGISFGGAGDWTQ